MTKKFKPKIKQPDDELKLLAWYRGKKLGENEWVYGFYAAQEETNANNKIGTLHVIRTPYEHGYTDANVVDPETVGRLIGFTANGKDIYHGDWVKTISGTVVKVKKDMFFRKGCEPLDVFGDKNDKTKI